VIRLVLFDIDGTLIQTGGAGVRAFGKAFENAFGLPNGTEQLKFAGRTDSSLVREFLSRHNHDLTAESLQRFYDCYVFWLDHLLDQCHGRTCPGVWSFLSDLQSLPQPPAFGLLTGNIRLGAEIKLRHYELWGLFSVGAFGDDHEHRDELAAIAQRRASRALGRRLCGEEILVIGDTPHDITCAKSIGARSLAVATGAHSVGELRGLQPTWVVAELGEARARELCAARAA